ncbi:MAG TPA: hypothetical protein VHZ32_03025, partial [Rhizomicrobium sp.]|nr:hypothetical protein [Rhizomicrobium sp.]
MLGEPKGAGREISRYGEAILVMFAGLLLLLAIYGYFYVRLYDGYLLVHDDPGNVWGTLAGGWHGWLTRGMAGYYHVYPEWPQPAFSNFYRPVWNLIIYAEQVVFGQRYWAWFLAFCLLQYCGALLFLRLLCSTGTPLRPALFFTILYLFNPAFLNFGFIYPGFQFDVFVSLFLIAACHELFHVRYGLALILITAALFTKETALFAPIAAAITVFILEKDVKWSAAMLAPLLIWIVARWLAFGAVLGGTFASPASFADLLANIGSGLMLWPSSAVPTNLPTHLAGSYGLVLLALLAMNFALWAFL